MNIEQERELFEEWYCKVNGTTIDNPYNYLDRDENGEYISMQQRCDFQVWQARAKVPSWISVDAPPENSTWVMIKTSSPLTNERIVTMAFYEFNEEANETYWLAHHNESVTADGWEDVTHWQPLPPMNGE